MGGTAEVNAFRPSRDEGLFCTWKCSKVFL